jgi:iron complex transport system substrate-binding protein
VGVEEIEKRRIASRPYMLAHPEIARLPRIGQGGPSGMNRKPDMEAILKLKPQIIFVTYMEYSQADALQQILQIPVVVLRYGRSATFDDAVLESIMLAGKVLGDEARARQVLDYIHALRTDLKARTHELSSDSKARAYVGGISYRGAYGIESTERSYIPMLWANADNIAEQLPSKIGSHVFIDKEKLIALDPKTIFIDAGGLAIILADYRKRADFYRTLSAFKNQRIFVLLPFNSYATNIETALADAYAIGKILYPDRFSDIDLEQKSDAIYRFFVGRPIYKSMEKSYAPIGSVAPFWQKSQLESRQ